MTVEAYTGEITPGMLLLIISVVTGKAVFLAARSEDQLVPRLRMTVVAGCLYVRTEKGKASRRIVVKRRI